MIVKRKHVKAFSRKKNCRGIRCQAAHPSREQYKLFNTFVHLQETRPDHSIEGYSKSLNITTTLSIVIHIKHILQRKRYMSEYITLLKCGVDMNNA